VLFRWRKLAVNLPFVRILARLVAPSVLVMFAAACSSQIQAPTTTQPAAPPLGASVSLYVSDHGNDTVKVVDSRGNATVIVSFRNPEGIALDGSSLYVVRYDGQKERNVLTKVNIADGAHTDITTGFDFCHGVAVDKRGNLYVTGSNLQGNGGVEKIGTDGKIATLGSGFSVPQGVAVDAAGNVYVADTFNNAIKKIAVNGTITVLGSGFFSPYGVAVDADGNVYVADTGNDSVKKISANGKVSCVYGTLASQDRRERCLGADFSSPKGVAVDGNANVYVADTNHNSVYEFGADGSARTIGSGFKSPIGLAI
jgi:large repetitive protein